MVYQQVISALDVILSPLTVFPYHISVLLISVLLTVLILCLNRVFINKDLMKQIKSRMEELRENLTQAQKEGNKENINKYMSEMMKTNSEYMRHSFKVLVISMIVVLIFLPWIKYRYEGLAVATLPFNLPFVGSSLNWLYWYILVSFAVGWIINKLFGT